MAVGYALLEIGIGEEVLAVKARGSFLIHDFVSRKEKKIED